MPNDINGTVTLQQAIENTDKFFPTRWDTKKRDVIKRIRIRTIAYLSPDRPGQPQVAYHIISQSWPQYKPYYTGKNKRGKPIKYQRSVKHQYNIILEMDKLSLSTTQWKLTLGTMKKWVKKPPQASVKQIYAETRKKWSKKQIETHKKKRGLYLDIGDYNSRKLGINADFIFRCAYAYWKNGHLYGRNYYGNVPAIRTNPNSIVFLPKHVLNMVEQLMHAGLMKR